MTTDPRIVPGVSNTLQSGTVDAPRVEAILANGSTSTLTNVKTVVVLVRDARKGCHCSIANDSAYHTPAKYRVGNIHVE